MVTGVRLVDKLANKRAPHVRIEAGSKSPRNVSKSVLESVFYGSQQAFPFISFHFLSFSFPARCGSPT